VRGLGWSGSGGRETGGGHRELSLGRTLQLLLLLLVLGPNAEGPAWASWASWLPLSWPLIELAPRKDLT